MYTVTLEQVKESFVETFCSGCCPAHCEDCEINKSSEAFFVILENLGIINSINIICEDINETKNKNKTH